MKIAFICPFAHVSVIERKEEIQYGIVPKEIQCVHLNCGHGAKIFLESVMDEKVVATHEFYKPNVNDILSIEEIEYCKSGGLMFREILSNVSKEVINEFHSTAEIVKMASYIISNFPEMTGKGTPVEAGIQIIETLREELKNSLPLSVGKPPKNQQWKEN